MMTSTSLGLIVPLGPDDAPQTIRALLTDTAVSSLWVRDLPIVGAADLDSGQGSDPWWYLGRLLGNAAQPIGIGTASIILGIRHPRVMARAAAGAQIGSGGRFVLGVGSGGKNEMNRALGIAGRPLAQFAQQWAELRAAMTDHLETGLSMHTPPTYRPPPIHLATSDLQRWEAIDGDADGWQTFLTDDRRRFDLDHARVCAIRGADTDVTLRLDAELVPPSAAGAHALFTHASRGRVRGTAQQVLCVVTRWTGPPVQTVLLRLHGYRPHEALLQLSDHTWLRHETP